MSGNHWWLFLLSYQTKGTYFSLEVFYPSRAKQSSRDGITLLSGIHPSTLPDHVTPSNCLFIGRLETERMKRGGSGGGGGWRGAGWQRTHEKKNNKFLPPLPGRWVNSRSRKSREGWRVRGTGWPAVVNNSSPYPAPKWLGKHGVLRRQKGPKGLREGHHPGVTHWQANTDG